MQKNEKAKEKSKSSGMIATFVFTVMNLMMLTLMAWFFLAIYFGVGWVFKGYPIQHVANTILAGNVRLFLGDSHSVLTTKVSTWFIASQQSLHAWLGWLPSSSKWQIGHSFLSIIVTVSDIIVSRVFILMLTIPLFLAVIFVFMADGLVKRDIRKFEAARESTFIFHRVKQLPGITVYVPFFIFMVVPFEVSPYLFLIPQALLFGMIVRLMAMYFKKYL
jgi:hypothetical protein